MYIYIYIYIYIFNSIISSGCLRVQYRVSLYNITIFDSFIDSI